MSVAKVKDLLKDFYPFAKERLGFDRVPKIKFLSNPENSTNPLGKTAFYESENDTVNVYVDSRHPKDILRSISHELVHHTQNCRGQLSNISAAGEQGYAQNDLHLREMERQAYELGNMCFRDWEDGYKMSRNQDVNIQEVTRTILRSLQERRIIDIEEATMGSQKFEEVEAAASAWKAAMHDDQAEAAFLEVIERYVEPELEQMGLQDESALSLSTAKLQWFSKDASKGDWSIEVSPAGGKANNDKPGWNVNIYRYAGKTDDNDMNVTETVGSIREALELVRATVQPNKRGQARPGEDPNQMELPLKEQDEPFPVGARVTHKGKTTLGVGTVVKMGKKPQERRIEWKESFRKPQTTTENIMMLQEASVKENTNMSKGILEEGFDQRLRNMVGEQIKVALENALLSEEDAAEEDEAEVSIDVDVDVDDGEEEVEESISLTEQDDERAALEKAIKAQTTNWEAFSSMAGMMPGAEEEADRAAKMVKELKAKLAALGENKQINIQEQDDERAALEKAIKAQTTNWEAFSSMAGMMPGAEEEADRAAKMVKELKAKLAALGEGLTLEEKVKAAVRGALAPAPLSLEEKIKNAIQGALLQEDDDKDDDEELSPAQKKLDLDDDGEIEGSDLAGLRSGKEDEDVGEEAEEDGGEEDEEKNEGYKPTSYNRDEEGEEEGRQKSKKQEGRWWTFQDH